MRKINRRAGAELIPSERINKMSSKSMRVTMATRLYRAGVPMAEIVEMGEWEDEAMARTYIRTLQAFAGERRNVSDVIAQQQQAAATAMAAASEVAAAASEVTMVQAAPAAGAQATVVEVAEVQYELMCSTCK